MKRSWRAPRPAVLARGDELADELLLRHPDEIDLAYILGELGAVLVHEPLPRGEGAMLRVGEGAIVSVDARLEGTPRGRFVGAHEAGHVELHPDVGLTAWCRGASGSFFQGEIDASDLGGRLLTPADLVAAWLRTFAAEAVSRGLTLAVARAFASAFRVPVAVALQRLVACLEEPLAVVGSRDAVVRWWAATDAWPFAVTKGFVLPRDVLARSGREDEVRALAWSKVRSARTATVLEHSVDLAHEGDGTVTLLRLAR